MPSSPSLPGANTISASPSKMVSVAVMMRMCSVARCAIARLLQIRQLLRLRLFARGLYDLVDAASHVEVLLRNIVVLAFEHLFEPANRVRKLDVLARTTCEDLGHTER